MEQQASSKLILNSIKPNVQRLEKNRLEQGNVQHHQRQKDAPTLKDDDYDVQQLYQKMQSWKQVITEQVETLKLQLKESEEIRQRQYNNIMQSQKSLTEVSLRYETEIKNKNNLLTKVQQTRESCQSLQERCTVITSSLHRMMSQRDDLLGTIQSDEQKRKEFEEMLCELQDRNGHTKVNITYKLEELKKQNESEKIALHKECEDIENQFQVRIDELKAQLLQERKEFKNIKMQLDFLHSQMENVENFDTFVIQNLEKKIMILKENENEILQQKEESEKLLQDLNAKNFEIEKTLQQKHQIEAELVTISERCSALKTRHNELLEELRFSENTFLEKESTYSNLHREKAEKIRDLEEQKDKLREELEVQRKSTADKVEELQNKIIDSEKFKMDLQIQLELMKEQISKLQTEIKHIDEQQTAMDCINDKLDNEIECVKVELCQKKANHKDTQLTYEDHLSAQQEQNTSLQRALMDMQRVHEQEVNIVIELSEKIDSLQDHLASMEEKKEKLETEVSNAKIQNQQVDERIKENYDNLAHNSELIKTLEAQVEVLQQNIQEEDEEFEKVHHTLTEELIFLQTRDETQNDLNVAHQVITSKEAESRHLKTEIELLTTIITEKDRSIKKVELEILEYRKKNDDMDETLNLELSSKEEKIKVLLDAYNQFVTTTSEMETQLQEENSSLECIVLQIEEAQGNIKNIKRRSQDKNDVQMKIMKDLTLSVETLQAQLCEKEQNLDNLKSTTEEKLEEMNHLQIDVEECKSQIRIKSEDLISKTQCIEELKAHLKKEEEYHNTTLLEVSKLSSELEMLGIKKQSFVTDYRRQREVIVNDISKIRQICSQRLDEIITLTRDIRETKNNVAQAQSELRLCEQMNEKLSQQTALKQKELEEIQTKLAYTQSLISHSDVEIKKLRHEVARFKKFNERACRDVAALKLTKRPSSDQDDLQNSLKGERFDFVTPQRKAPRMSIPLSDSPTITPTLFLMSSRTSTPQPLGKDAGTHTPNTGMHTPNTGAATITPRSILKSSKQPTPQKVKSVSFAMDSASDCSIIIEPEDAEAIEKDPRNVRKIIERQKELQESMMQTNQAQPTHEDYPPPERECS